jgi:hypothetical protein
MSSRPMNPPRVWRWMLAALLPLFAATAGAQMPETLKTRNVVLVVSDGLRWQEVFTGADPTLLNEKDGGIWDKEADLKRDYWRPDPAARRKALFPFLWGTVATRGQIYGNQAKGSVAKVTNGLAFSYPGYNEMITGHPDARINSNEFGPNPNISVFEWLNGQPELHGKVAVFGTWAIFKDIFNVQRSSRLAGTCLTAASSIRARRCSTGSTPRRRASTRRMSTTHSCRCR